MKPLVRSISILVVALVWLYLAASIVHILTPFFERLFKPFPTYNLPEGPAWWAWLLAATLVLGTVTAWRMTFAGPLDIEARTQRSVLSVWPGWPLAIVGVVVSAAALVLAGSSPRSILMLIVNLLDDYLLATVPLTLAAAAAVTGGRSKGAAVLLAAPATLILLVGLVAEISIVQLSAALCAPAAALAAGFATLASVTGRQAFVWLAIGFASIAVVALLLVTGFFTPSEVLGVVSVLAVAIGLLVHGLIDRSVPWRVFAIGANEILAATSAIVLARLVGVLARVYGIGPLATLPVGVLELIAVVATVAAGCALTPVLTISLLGGAFFQMLGQASLRVGSLVVLAGVAAMALRSIDWTPVTEPGSSMRISRTTGLTAMAILFAVGLLMLAFWPGIETLLGSFLG